MNAECLAYYQDVAKKGTAKQVLIAAKISKTFRELYPQAISWAYSKLSKKPKRLSP